MCEAMIYLMAGRLPVEADWLGNGRHVVGLGTMMRCLEAHQPPRRIGDQDAKAAQDSVRICQRSVNLLHQARGGYAVRVHETQVPACTVICSHLLTLACAIAHHATHLLRMNHSKG